MQRAPSLPATGASRHEAVGEAALRLRFGQRQHLEAIGGSHGFGDLARNDRDAEVGARTQRNEASKVETTARWLIALPMMAAARASIVCTAVDAGSPTWLGSSVSSKAHRFLPAILLLDVDPQLAM